MKVSVVRRISVLVLALLFALSFVNVSHASESGDLPPFPLPSDKNAQPASMAGRPYWYWNVTIQGNALGYSFQRTGYLIATPTIDTLNASQNGVNPLDIWLISGNPPATPETGAIWFATNRAFYSNIGDMNAGSLLDLAYVTWDGSTATLNIQPDPTIAAASTFNVFNATSGLTADMYQIKDGQMLLQFQNDFQTVVGQANLVGTGFLYYSNTPYSATISGTFGGSGTW